MGHGHCDQAVSLAERELHQIELGNKLLLSCVLVIVAIFISSGSFVLEHPADIDGDAAPSIWRVPLLKWLKQLQGIEQHLIMQRSERNETH